MVVIPSKQKTIERVFGKKHPVRKNYHEGKVGIDHDGEQECQRFEDNPKSGLVVCEKEEQCADLNAVIAYGLVICIIQHGDYQEQREK